MSYQPTYACIKLMRFLMQHRYAGLPAVLFNRHLWFYGELEEIQHSLIYGTLDQHPCLFENSPKDAECLGIAYLTQKDDQLTILLNAIDQSDTAEFIQRVCSENPGAKATITLADPQLASSLCAILGSGWSYAPGKVKCFTENKVPITPIAAREMFLDDERYLEALPQRVWGAYKIFLDLGYRFWGWIEGERLVSMCGLVQHTPFYSEIIGVETFSPQDRGKRYAHAVCALALNEGLKNTSVVTWSTDLTNEASCRTANHWVSHHMTHCIQ